MAEILIYMDSEDKSSWEAVVQLHNNAVINARHSKENKIPPDINLALELKKKTAEFWHDAIEKYGVLRNKRLNLDQLNGTINCFSSISELKR